MVVRHRPKIAAIEKATVRSGTGLNMEISCVISGHPTPKVTWYKDEEVLFHDGRVNVSMGGTRHYGQPALYIQVQVHSVCSIRTGL